MTRKNKTFWGVLGTILLIFGAIGTISLAVKGQEYLYGLFVTGAFVIVGVLLIAWAFAD